MERTKRKQRVDYPLLFLALVIGLACGVMLGLLIEQLFIKETMIGVAEAFNGKVEINLNETKMVEDSKNILVPTLTHVLNNTVVREFGNCKKIKYQDTSYYLLNCTEAK